MGKYQRASKLRYLELFLVHRHDLLIYANRIMGDRASAEDVVQDAYLRFAGSSEKRLIEEPVGYLYRIVRNLAVDGRRRQSRDGYYDTSEPEMMAELIGDHPSPETVVADREEIRILQAALAELPQRTRIALEMHRFGGCTLKVIATHLGISIGLAHTLVIDGLEHCRARLCRPSRIQ
ncbi:MAG: sigma-70 family RNA polymerase sigma factor [Proteobacteria bacterium]|nr:sigma-70 family RNA polymerase sigma factor [Pseudomonadota bacterium]